MGVKQLLLFALLIFLSSCEDTTEGDGFDTPEGYQSRSGKEIYGKHCQLCHGPDGKLGSGGAADLSKSKMDSTKIISLIKKGKNGMPRQIQNFKSEEELTNIVDYLNTLRK